MYHLISPRPRCPTQQSLAVSCLAQQPFALLPSHNQSLCCYRATIHSVSLAQPIALLLSCNNHSLCCPLTTIRSVALAQPITLLPSCNHSLRCPRATNRSVALAQPIALLPSQYSFSSVPRSNHHHSVDAPRSYYHNSRENLTPIVLPSLGDNTREKRYCSVQSIVSFSLTSC